MANSARSIPAAVGIPASGWTPLDGAFTYASVDGPTGVMNTPSDLSAVIPLGARIKLTQTTVKYFIVTAITSTTITMYGGTDYTLANAAISLPYYSLMKAPVGFPLNPRKWTQELVDTSNPTQAGASSSTWYNLGSLSLSVPIGIWNLSFKVTPYVASNGNVSGNYYEGIKSALSTSASTPSDNDLIAYIYREDYFGAASNYSGNMTTLHVEKVVALTSKTTFYLIANMAGANNSTDIYHRGGDAPTIIRAVCAYL
jgi:hypothetical protein